MLQAWENVEPFGFELDNFRAAVVANTVSRAGGNKTALRDFYPQIKRADEDNMQTRDEQIAILTAAAGGAEVS